MSPVSFNLDETLPVYRINWINGVQHLRCETTDSYAAAEVLARESKSGNFPVVICQSSNTHEWDVMFSNGGFSYYRGSNFNKAMQAVQDDLYRIENGIPKGAPINLS